MKRRTFIAASATILSGCSSTRNKQESEPDRQTDTNTQTSTPRKEILEVKRGDDITHTFNDILQVRDFGWTDRELNFGTPGAAGVVKNLSRNRLAKAALAVDFYDEETQIGSNTSWFDFLETGEYGTLEVPYTEDDPNRVTRIQVSTSVQESPILSVNNGQVTVNDNEISETEHGWPTVTGTIVNNTNDRLERVMIHVNFYHGQELLAQSRDSASRLGPEERAEWSAPTNRADPDEITRYSTVTTIRK
ncbi:FxLYD domain-containing protein [Natrinema hispanicum]|uniref:Uncharacterized protein n=1 Tax=Natrinema hispanicum TaxID=392421 RepID=A0A1I0IU69_9EURY|nr:FxLYD domain-containing protein [Natrinema hispanicum]SEU00744.1 hypothetical protein SAMN04488694_1265 [Natrinema hispanicum]